MKRRVILSLVIFLAIHFSAISTLKAETVVYAAGADNTILRLSEGSWISLYNELTTEDLVCVWESPDGEVFAAGTNGAIVHYDGSEWEVMSSGTTAELSYIWGAASDDVFVMGYPGEILHYDGVSWTLQYSSPVSLWGLWGFDGDDVYACGKQAHIVHYDGSSWTLEYSEPGVVQTLYIILAWSPDSLSIMGEFDWDEWGYDSYDFDGVSWNKSLFPAEPNIIGYQNILPDTVIYYGEGGMNLFDGSTWTEVSGACNIDYQYPIIRSSWVSSAGGVHNLYVSGYLCDRVGGFTRKSGNPLAADLNGLHGRADDDLWAVGDGGIVMRFDGSEWNLVLGRLSGCEFGGIYGADESEVWVAGCSNMILRLDGESLAMVDFSPEELLDRDFGTMNYRRVVDLHGNSGTDIVCTAEAPGSYLEEIDLTIGSYDGISWSEITGPEGLSGVSKVCGGPGGTVFLTGTIWNSDFIRDDWHLYRYDGAWADISVNACGTGSSYCDTYMGDFFALDGLTLTTGKGMEMPSMQVKPLLYSLGAAGSPAPYGEMFSTDQYGIWGIEMDAGGSPQLNLWLGGEDGSVTHYIPGVSSAACTTGTTSALRAVWGSCADDIYAVGDGGAIVHYDGSSWSVMSSGTTSDLLAVWGVEIAVSHADDREMPEAGALLTGNYPNPFNPNTTIEYYLPERCRVDLSVYDVKGRLVRVLFSGTQDNGLKSVRWDGLDGKGRQVNSGVYFCRLKAGGEYSSRKLVISR